MSKWANLKNDISATLTVNEVALRRQSCDRNAKTVTNFGSNRRNVKNWISEDIRSTIVGGQIAENCGKLAIFGLISAI